MKNRFSGAQRIASLFVLLALALHASTRAFAQTPNAQTLPQLEVAPSVAGADGVFTLSLPVAPQGKSTRIAIYEHLRPNKLAEIKKNFTLQNGRWSTQLQLEADPGSYDLRVVSDDKTRAPLSSDAGVLVPGIVREPGWWLFNGLPFNGLPFFGMPQDSEALSSPSAPLFLSGLKRGIGGKAQSGRSVFAATDTPLTWKVVDIFVPEASPWERAQNPDRASPRRIIADALQKAHNGAQRNYLGFEIHFNSVFHGNISATDVRQTVVELRREIQAAAPEAALILGIDGVRTPQRITAQQIEACADLCDAVVLNLDPRFNSTWPIKVARRVAEEQANYDLPILVNWSTLQSKNAIKRAGYDEQSVLLDYLMSGATCTGRDFRQDQFSIFGPKLAQWGKLVLLNAPLFIGSATLEDAGLLSMPAMKDFSPASMPSFFDDKELLYHDTASLYETLREAGRIPGAARLQTKTNKKIPESFLCVLGDLISPDTIEKLRVAANSGARIYLEGAPKIKSDVARWNALVGAASTPVPKKLSSITLDDPWLFGTARGSKIPIEQNTQVGALNAPTKRTSKKDEPEKGKDVLTAPRVVAKLEDGSPALIENPIGDGEVLWSPHRILSFDSSIENASAQRDFYSAVAAHLGTGLLKIRAVGSASTPAVRAAIRRSKNGTWLVGLFNASDKAAPIVVEANHFAGVALDLQSEKALPLNVRGNRSSVETIVPANGWQIIALAESREKLDEERFAPRSKAKLK